MKKAVTLLAVFIIVAHVFLPLQASAQAPEKMSYQAVIRNNSNNLVTKSNIGIQVSILQNSADGPAVYVERHFPTTNSNGLITIEIGSGTVVSGSFSTINWPSGPYYIKTETDLNGGANYTITGTSQILSVPYALHAKTADSVSGLITEAQDLADVIAIGNSANAQIKNVTDPTDNQDAATKLYIDSILRTFQIMPKNYAGIMTDIQGNIYKIVKIGSQTWMAENLRTVKFNDNTNIELVETSGTWASLTSPAFCWYQNDALSYKATYGALYNWYAVNSGKLCPEDWHVPDNAEWTTLQDYLGGESIAGRKMKEIGTSHWDEFSDFATNESGFTALPAGYRYWYDGYFGYLKYYGFWWSANEENADNAWYWEVTSSAKIYKFSADKNYGYSVRCIKD